MNHLPRRNKQINLPKKETIGNSNMMSYSLIINNYKTIIKFYKIKKGYQNSKIIKMKKLNMAEYIYMFYLTYILEIIIILNNVLIKLNLI